MNLTTSLNSVPADSLPEERAPWAWAPSSLSRPDDPNLESKYLSCTKVAPLWAPRCSLAVGRHSLGVEEEVAGSKAFRGEGSADGAGGWLPSSCRRPHAPNWTSPQHPHFTRVSQSA